jgi:Ser/Thr protein kinase RdoA (MazF antagonist)
MPTCSSTRSTQRSVPLVADDAATLALGRLAERALHHWDVDVTALRFVSARENAVYRVDARDGRSYALRIHRPGYHTLAELQSENHWTTALHDGGIDTPRPIPTRSGAAYLTVPFGNDGDTRSVGMIEWVDGDPLDVVLERGTRNPVVVFRALGVVAAQMHNHATRWALPERFVRHALDADGLVGEAPWWGQFWDVPEMTTAERTLILSTRAAIHQALVDYGTTPTTYSLIHADLLAQNLLVDNGRVAVIDFDDAAFGWHQYDLAVALIDYLDHGQFASYRDALVAGYRSTRPLSDEALSLLPMFLTIRTLVSIGWLHGRLAGHVTTAAGETITRAGTIPPRIRTAVGQCEALLPTLG